MDYETCRCGHGVAEHDWEAVGIPPFASCSKCDCPYYRGIAQPRKPLDETCEQYDAGVRPEGGRRNIEREHRKRLVDEESRASEVQLFNEEAQERVLKNLVASHVTPGEQIEAIIEALQFLIERAPGNLPKPKGRG